MQRLNKVFLQISGCGVWCVVVCSMYYVDLIEQICREEYDDVASRSHRSGEGVKQPNLLKSAPSKTEQSAVKRFDIETFLCDVFTV